MEVQGKPSGNQASAGRIPFSVRISDFSRSQLDEAISQADKALAGLREERKSVEKKHKPYQVVLQLLGQIDEAAIEAKLYSEEYPEYQEEYMQYQMLVEKLSGLGYSITDARTVENHIQSERKSLEDRHKELLKEKGLQQD